MLPLKTDPLVILRYDADFIAVRASRLDDFVPGSNASKRWRRSVTGAIQSRPADYIAIDRGLATREAVITTGRVPVKWQDGKTHNLTGWVHA